MTAPKYRSISIILTGVLLGFLVVLQSRSFGNVQNQIQRDSRANVFREIQILKTTNENLTDEIASLEDQLAKASDQELALKGIKDEIRNDKIIAGHVDTDSWTIDSGFTIYSHVDQVGGDHYGHAHAYLVQGTAGSVNPTWGATAATNSNVIAVFKPAAGGGGGGGRIRPSTLLTLGVQ